MPTLRRQPSFALSLPLSLASSPPNPSPRPFLSACAHPRGPANTPFPPPGAKPVPSWRPAGLLREAVEIKRVEVDLINSTLLDRPDHPVNLRRAFYSPAPASRLTTSLKRPDGTLAVVAAMKRFQPQPSGPPTRVADLPNIGRDVRGLELAGADAAFVYTDQTRYGCDLKEMTMIVTAVAKTSADRGAPVARLDLIVDAVQIAEAAAAGAEAVVIIAAAALDDIGELLDSATAMGVEAVVECHTELERDLAVECGATLLLFTNRDRATNEVVPGTAERLREGIPDWVVTIGGGGIVTAGDCWSLMDAGFDAVVMGETLLQSRRPKGLIDEIRSQKRIAARTPFDPGFSM